MSLQWLVIDVEGEPRIIGQCKSEEEAREVVETQVRPWDYVVAADHRDSVRESCLKQCPTYDT